MRATGCNRRWSWDWRCWEMVGTGMAATTGSESAEIVEVLRTPMIDHSLPLWSGQGGDRVAGGFDDVGRFHSRLFVLYNLCAAAEAMQVLGLAAAV